MFIDATVAAGQIGHLISGENIRVEAAKNGACQLFSMADGLVGVDAGLVDHINQMNDSISVACLALFTRVSKNQLIGVVQIVSSDVEASVLVEITQGCLETKALCLKPFWPNRVGLVVTQKANTLDESIVNVQKSLNSKIQVLGSEIGRSSVVEHSGNAIAVALNAIIPHHDLALVFGAVDIENRDDVLPQAVRQLNGHIEHFGLPVSPGNRLLLAQIGKMPLLGVPVCVQDETRSGFDLVLERLLANVSVSAKTLQAMGVGGLLISQADNQANNQAHN